MSYDLMFWKQTKPTQLAPVEVYKKLNSRENLQGQMDLPEVAELPVDQILGRLKAAYPDFDSSAGLPCFETPDGHYDVSWSKKHFLFMIYADLGDSLNPLVDIMHEYGCAMFDPQENKRYDADNGLAVGKVPRFQSPTAEEKLERKRRYDAILKQAEGQLAGAERTNTAIKMVLGVCVAVALVAMIWYWVKR